MEKLGKRVSYQKAGQQVQIQFEKGTAFVNVLTDRIMNVFLPLETKDHRSKAFEGDKEVPTEFQVAEADGALVISTSNVVAKVYDDFFVDFYDKNGKLLCADSRDGRVFQSQISERFIEFLKAEGHEVPDATDFDYPVQVIKKIQGDESFYGLGDKTGFLNKRHYEYENWNSDIPQAHTDSYKALYKSIPFLITLRKDCVYGLFFDNTYKSYVNLGKENEGYLYYGADAGNLDYYFIAGETMPEIVEGYTYLTGRTPLPQLWTLGYQQSRWGYECAGDIRDIAEHYRDLKIPCDTIHFDIDYMDGYRVFTWDDKAFGKPGAIIDEIGKQGFKVVTIIDPGVKLDPGYSKYDEGIENHYFATTPEGEVYVNAVWPGDAVYPDYGKPETRAWWADNQKFLLDLGVRGVWNDMNEPASFRGELPEDVVFTDEDRPINHAKMHNVYGHLMSKATYEGLKKYDGKRPFVITRACYAGTQKYSTVWTGDNQSLWSHLQMAVPQLCNLGLSGLAFAGTDVGGFGADCTPELLCRWVQVGCFSPLFRNHSSKGSTYQEPWRFDKQTIDINRKFVELRYRLLPYLYDLFHECEKTGLPIIRPLVLHYEKDEEVKNLNTEFLFGEHILVAPVLEQGATKKMVYLPEGTWYDFETGKEYAGGQYYLVDAPLDVCPMFVKAGSVIPTYDVVQYVGEKPYDTLKLLTYPGKGSYVHYQDNGEDFKYQDGEYALYEFHNENGVLTAAMSHAGYRPYKKITSTNVVTNETTEVVVAK